MPLEIVGMRARVVDRIELGGLIRVRFSGEPEAYLDIESPCEVVTPTGESTTVRYQPGDGAEPAGLDAMASLYGATLSVAEERPDGSFHFAFASGESLSLPVDPNFEAGHRVLGDDYRVVPPGGR
jgi:hypothetical protein